MNWFKIIGFTLVTMSVYGLLKLIVKYVTGQMDFWPFGAETGAALCIALGVFLVRRGNRNKSL